jgi:hypothetical protein
MKFRVKEEYITGVVQASHAKSREEKIYEAPARQSTFSVSNRPANEQSLQAIDINGKDIFYHFLSIFLLPPTCHEQSNSTTATTFFCPVDIGTTRPSYPFYSYTVDLQARLSSLQPPLFY